MASLGFVILSKASTLLVSSLHSGYAGETPDLGLPDQTMAALDVVTPLEGIVFGGDVDWSSLKVDRWKQRVSIASTGMGLGSAVQRGPGGGSMLDVDVRAQDGGVVGHHGGVDGRHDKVIAMITPEDWIAEDGGGDFEWVQWCMPRICWTGCTTCSLLGDLSRTLVVR